MKRGKRRGSMRYQIAIPVGLMIAVMVAVICVLGFRSSYGSLKEVYLDQLASTNEDIARQLEFYYQQQENYARFLAGNSALIEAVKAEDYAKASEFLKGFYDELGLFENAFISTPQADTEIVADGTGGTAVGLHWAGTGFDDNITHTLGGELWISNPYRSPVTDLPVVLVTTPMMDGGELLAMVGLPFDLGTFAATLVSNVKIGQTGYPAISDLNALVFAHPDPKYILELDLKEYDWGMEMLNSPSGTIIEYPWNGQAKILTSVRNEEYGYIATSTMYLSDVDVHGFAVAKTLALVGVIGVLITIFFLVLILAWKLKPIRSAADLADSIGKGDFNVEIKSRKSRDEVGVLSDSFGSMVEALKYKARIVEEIAEGDLTVDIEKASDVDGLGQSLIDMNTSLHSVLSQVNAAVDQLSSGSDQVAQASQSLSQGATEQASSLEEISSSVNEINSQSRQNAENATEANALAKTSAENAESGNQQMQELVVAMGKINESSDEIKKVVKVIDDIAFQTNLLALNANVEAARAGKYGKGFAVVAEEVRNLAVRSAEAVKETTHMVEESIRNIELGTKSAEATAGQLGEIVNGSSKVADFLGEIALASKEQAQGVDQVTSGLEQIDQVTQSNTASAEESASAAEELASQGQQLKALVATFKLSGNGNGEAVVAETANEQPVAVVAAPPADPKAVISLDDEDFGKF